jgi:hypothetical protein
MSFLTNGDQNVVIGSGDLYAIPITEIEDPFNLTTEEEENLRFLGYIESNAVLNAAIEKQEIEAANAGTVAEFIKKKTVTFSTGIFSWCLESVAELLTGSKYEDDIVGDKKSFTYSHEDQSPNVFLRFIKTDEKAGKKIIIDMYKGSFNDDLAFDFNNDNPCHIQL